MKIHDEEFIIKSEKVNNGFVFCVVGDIHNTKYSKLSTWKKIIETVKASNPNFIIIPGDLIYTADDLKDSKDKLNYLLVELSKIAPVYITYGNHDLKNGDKLTNKDTDEYFRSLSKDIAIHILNNKFDMIKDSNVYLLGISPSYDSYYSEYKDKWAINFISELLKIDIKEIDDNKLLIIVIHSPEILIEVRKYIEEQLNSNISENTRLELKKAKDVLELVTIFVSAHMHNGLIARKFEFGKRKNNSKGFVVSEGQKENNGEVKHKVKLRIVDYCRGMHDLYNGKIIITRGITKWCQPNPLFGLIDQTCSKDINTIKVLRK